MLTTFSSDIEGRLLSVGCKTTFFKTYRRSNGFGIAVIYMVFGQKVVPANDIIMKFMAAACITRQMIYAQKVSRCEANARWYCWELLATDKQDTNLIVIFCYLFRIKWKFRHFWWIKFTARERESENERRHFDVGIFLFVCYSVIWLFGYSVVQWWGKVDNIQMSNVKNRSHK